MLDVLAKSWFDFVVIAVLIRGIYVGRRTGLSGELLDLVKWLCILGAAAFAYEPLGRSLSQATVFSLLGCYIAVYVMIILAVMVLFSFIKRAVGDKLITSDAFGSGEYYLGMVAGCVRFACILIVGLAFMNARLYSKQEVQARAKFQKENFGDISFPTFQAVQSDVFELSNTGKFAKEYLDIVLITPTRPESKSLRRSGSSRRTTGLNDMLEKK